MKNLNEIILVSDKNNGFYIPSLDGIRAIAISLVFISHSGYGHIVPGGFGVTIFFFLSGYLITTLLRREYESTGAINLKDFYIRRIYRIWPNFYMVLVVGLIATKVGIIPGEIKIEPVLAQFFHLANYFSANGAVVGTAVYWSLAVEEHFYLIFPILYIFLIKLNFNQRKILLSLILLCCIALAWRFNLMYFSNPVKDRIYMSTDTRFDSLLFGCMLAIYGNPVIDKINYTKWNIIYFCIPLSIAVLLFCLVYRSDFFRETLRYSLQGIALYPLFMAAILFQKNFIFKFLNIRFMRFIGKMSYSVYLTHLTIIHVVIYYGNNYPHLILISISFLLTLFVSYLIYRVIEMPFARLRKKLSHVS